MVKFLSGSSILGSSIETSEITNDAVTTAKIADDNVTPAKLSFGSKVSLGNGNFTFTDTSYPGTAQGIVSVSAGEFTDDDVLEIDIVTGENDVTVKVVIDDGTNTATVFDRRVASSATTIGVTKSQVVQFDAIANTCLHGFTKCFENVSIDQVDKVGIKATMIANWIENAFTVNVYAYKAGALTYMLFYDVSKVRNV